MNNSKLRMAGGIGHSGEEGEGWDDDEGFDALEGDPHEAEAAERLRRLNMRTGGAGAAARSGSVASGSGRGGGAGGGLGRQGSLDSDTSLASGFSHTSSHLTSGHLPPGTGHSLPL